MKCERLISKIEIETVLMTVIKRDRVNHLGENMDKNLLGLLLDYHKHHQPLHRAERLR